MENLALELTCYKVHKRRARENVTVRHYMNYNAMCRAWFKMFGGEITNDSIPYNQLIENIKVFLDNGVPADVQDGVGVLDCYPRFSTALHLTTLYDGQKRMKVMKYLLQNGADPNAKDERGRTPAHWLSWDWNCEADYRILKAMGANLWERDNFGALPEDNAPSARVKEIVAAIRG